MSQNFDNHCHVAQALLHGVGYLMNYSMNLTKNPMNNTHDQKDFANYNNPDSCYVYYDAWNHNHGYIQKSCCCNIDHHRCCNNHWNNYLPLHSLRDLSNLRKPLTLVLFFSWDAHSLTTEFSIYINMVITGSTINRHYRAAAYILLEESISIPILQNKMRITIE